MTIRKIVQHQKQFCRVGHFDPRVAMVNLVNTPWVQEPTLQLLVTKSNYSMILTGILSISEESRFCNLTKLLDSSFHAE